MSRPSWAPISEAVFTAKTLQAALDAACKAVGTPADRLYLIPNAVGNLLVYEEALGCDDVVRGKNLGYIDLEGGVYHPWE